jgi:lipopolysaccharide transport system ATP-binding protein
MGLISARDLIIEFPVYGSKSRSIKSAVLNAATGGRIARDAADHVVVRAINRVSFELRDGDRVGLVGHNGSGKSTLLRVLAGAYEPGGGTLRVEGSIASMLNIWLGMDLEATGYENIFMRAVVMGMRRHEIEGMVDEIIDFSQLGEYIDMPLRTYSSGMAMRLAFSISTAVSADILLMDEWLSAGDAEFSEKARRRINEVVSRARILVLASHDDSLIRSNCNKIMNLSHGELVSLETV